MAVDVTKPQSQWRRVLKQWLRNRRAVVGAIVLLVIIFMAIFAPYVATHDPTKQNIRNQLKPPSREHFFGTDQFGRDTYSALFTELGCHCGWAFCPFPSPLL